MKYNIAYISIFIVLLSLGGCTSKGLSANKLEEKDLEFEAFLVKEFNEINRLKGRNSSVQQGTKMNRNNIFYSQIHGE